MSRAASCLILLAVSPLLFAQAAKPKPNILNCTFVSADEAKGEITVSSDGKTMTLKLAKKAMIIFETGFTVKLADFKPKDEIQLETDAKVTTATKVVRKIQDTEAIAKNMVVDTVDSEKSAVIFRLPDGETMTFKFTEKTKFLDADGFPVKPSDFKKKDKVDITYFFKAKELNSVKKRD